MIGENFLLDFAGLLGVSLWTKTPMKGWRSLLAALFGVVGGVLCFLFVQNFFLYSGIVFGIINPLMLWIGFGKKSIRKTAELYVTCMILHLLLGGGLNFLEQMIPTKAYGWILVMGGLLLLMCIFFLQLYMEKRDTLVKMSVLIGNTVKQGIAYKDTGNCLRDSITRLPVCIVPKAWMKEAGIVQENLRCISFETVSGEDIIYVYPVTNFFLWEKDEMQLQKRMMVGFAKDTLFCGKEYQMILHKDFC